MRNLREYITRCFLYPFTIATLYRTNDARRIFSRRSLLSQFVSTSVLFLLNLFPSEANLSTSPTPLLLFHLPAASTAVPSRNLSVAGPCNVLVERDGPSLARLSFFLLPLLLAFFREIARQPCGYRGRAARKQDARDSNFQ